MLTPKIELDSIFKKMLQIYVDMYERSKEKYAVEMSAYNCKN